MQIDNLQNATVSEIADCFNKAFENYFVPLKMDANQLSDKIKSENITPEYSIGIWADTKLVGFILTGIDAKSKVAYNAGTGIIEEYRGKGFTEKMYSALLLTLRENEFNTHLLEVICDNRKALAIYQNLGYTILRKVICYKGSIAKPYGDHYKIEAIDLPNENTLNPFWNQKPTYQNSMFCIKNNPEKHMAFATFDKEKLIGYIVFDKNTLRVKQFAVDRTFRDKGLGHQLFGKVQSQRTEQEVSIINVDENDLETNNFLKAIGLKKVIEQYEMILCDD